jgi:DNA-binding transcriptional ArsR family regulator
MDIKNALLAFNSLSQETRLRVFRLLVQAGPKGIPAGGLSEALDIPHNTLSFHLSQMNNAGLISSRREGRSVIYSANFELMRDLIRFMVENCCSGEFASIQVSPDQSCAVIDLPACCQPEEKEK